MGNDRFAMLQTQPREDIRLWNNKMEKPEWKDEEKKSKLYRLMITEVATAI